MPCKHYKEALIEAAAISAQPQGDLRGHLDACGSCRAAFEQEQSLFASIDAGLHTTANAEVPASLLPRVRARLDEAAAVQRRWFQPWIFAPASLALALAIFLFARPHHSGRDNQAKQTPQIPVTEIPVTNPRRQNSVPGTQIVSSNVNNSQRRGRSTLSRPVASSQPQVLVPPDEREALARFVVVLQEHREVAVALVTPAMPTKDESANLEPLQINGLEIKLLEERQTEASDGAEQKQ
jgi:hypothetical protein